MDRSVYDRMQALEDEHWWFVGRRRILSAVLERSLPRSGPAAILEAGCGTGGNLAMLQGFGSVDAFEVDEPSCDFARQRSGLDVRVGSLPDAVPFPDSRYRAIALFDVLEHVDRDVDALNRLSGLLAEDGRIFVTVPAFPILWSAHDERHHHFRRYTARSLRETAERAGLTVERLSYFNTLLLAPAVAMRLAKAGLRRDTPDDAMPPRRLNRMLAWLFALERYPLARVDLPVGLSLLGVFAPRHR